MDTMLALDALAVEVESDVLQMGGMRDGPV